MFLNVNRKGKKDPWMSEDLFRVDQHLVLYTQLKREQSFKVQFAFHAKLFVAHEIWPKQKYW